MGQVQFQENVAGPFYSFVSRGCGTFTLLGRSRGNFSSKSLEGYVATWGISIFEKESPLLFQMTQW
jgi:hypothetical protein